MGSDTTGLVISAFQHKTDAHTHVHVRRHQVRITVAQTDLRWHDVSDRRSIDSTLAGSAWRFGAPTRTVCCVACRCSCNVILQYIGLYFTLRCTFSLRKGVGGGGEGL